MKYTKEQIKDLCTEAIGIEIYKYTGKNHRVHTDTLNYIGPGNFDETELDELPYDENGEVDVDIFLMDNEDYDRTIYANCGEHSDMEPGEKMAIVIVR